MHRDHGASVHEHPVPYDARRAVVSGLVRERSQRLAFDFHHRFLQHLQAKRSRPGARWVLKAPGHLFALEGLLERYPDARIIHTHRDPLRVIASMASHATVLRRAFSDSADPLKIAADWADRWSRALDKFLAVRDRASRVAVPRRQFRIDRDRSSRHRRTRLRFPGLAADDASAHGDAEFSRRESEEQTWCA